MKFLVSGLLYLALCGTVVAEEQCVILLHGLARSAASMDKMETKLREGGFQTVNQDYPSREFPIKTLALLAIEPALADCRQKKAGSIHFVTHSLGGILVRQYLLENAIPELHRVVMLGPPNQGSEAVDELQKSPGFDWINGPAGHQLGTGRDSIPRKLGPANFTLGVIAGSSSINPILSQMLPGKDDGKVTVEGTKIEGMDDFIVLPVSHPFLMRDRTAISQTVHFLQYGAFEVRDIPAATRE